MAVFSRTSEETSTTKSPIVKFLEWKGAKDTGYFSFYNKESKENEVFDLEDEFIVLKTGWSVKGFNERTKGFYSNEVDKIGSEVITVRAGNEILARGVWKDIKEQVLTLGGKLQRVITILYNGEILGIAVKGSALFELNTLLSTSNITKVKLKFDRAELRKKGAVEYNVPLFVEGSAVTPDDVPTAEVAAKKVSAYYYKEKEEAISETDIEPQYQVEGEGGHEDLPFK